MALADLMSIETKTEEENVPTIIKAETADGAGDVNCVSAINFNIHLSSSLLKRIQKKTENPSLTPLFWSMPNLSQLTFSMMIQINAFTSAQAVKLATDSKTSYEGLEASRISKITLPNFTNPVDTSHGNVTTAVEAEVNVTMIKSKDIQSSLASVNVNASNVLTNEIFANTQNDPIFNPNIEVKLEEEDSSRSR